MPQAQAINQQPQPNTPAFNLQATIAGITQANPNLPTYQTQQQQGFGQAHSNQSAQPAAGTPDLTAILARITGQAANATPPIPTFGYNGGAMQQDTDRKRPFEENDQDEFGMRKKSRGPAPQVDQNKFFQLPCRFWKEGKCKKGSECTYRHEG